MNNPIVGDDTRYELQVPGVIIAHDKKSLNEYKKSYSVKKRKSTEINTLKSDVKELKNQMKDIQDSLAILIELQRGNK